MEMTWTSIARWLLHAGLGGSLLIVLTLLAMRCVRQPARRQRLGELGLAAALVLACLCWRPAWLPLWDSAPAPPPLSYMLVSFEAAAPQPAPAPLKNPVLLPQPSEPVPGSDANVHFDVSAWLIPGAVLAYGLGMACYLTRWLAGVVALWRIVRAAQPATPALCEDFQRRCSGRRRPRLLISTRLRVPVSCGLWKPTVILPASLTAPEQAAERDWVFAHEVTHLARRDAWSALLFAVGQMAYFALPWFWWLRRVVRLCQEYVADAAAVRQRPADEYAEFLLSLTTSPAAPLAATGVTGTTSDLYRRVSMLLQNPVRVELSCPRGWTIGAAGVLLSLAVVAAGVGPAQADPPNQKEILEQLNRIQDLVNKLRDQVAEPAKDPTKKELPKDGKTPGDVTLQRAVTSLQAAVRQEAAAQLSRTAKERDVAAQQRSGARQALNIMRGGGHDANLSDVIKLLQKQQAELKDEKVRQHLQEAIDRLKDAMKQQKPAPGKVVAVPPAVSVPMINPVPNAAYAGQAKATIVAQPKERVLLWDTTDGKTRPERSQGRLGVRVEAPSDLLAEQLNLPKDQGLVVTEVLDNSVAKKSGIQVNDLLLKINNQPVPNQPDALIKVVSDLKADTPFDIVVLRRGKSQTIQNVRLAEPAGWGRYTVRAVDSNQAQLTITARRTGEKLTLSRSEGPVTITVSAEIADGKNKVISIAIMEPGKTSKHAKVDEVPEPHRAKVQNLLQLLDTIQIRGTPQGQAPGSKPRPSPDNNFLFLEDGQDLRLHLAPMQADGEAVLRWLLAPAEGKTPPALNRYQLRGSQEIDLGFPAVPPRVDTNDLIQPRQTQVPGHPVRPVEPKATLRP
jgi:hypothetical protein